MNGNAPNDPTEDSKAASGPVPAAPAGAAAPPPSAELDLEVEEIRRPPLMKEGFVGQER
jgi:hypothetical protein